MPFARILRSSALMGGAQVVVLAAAFIRAKAIALIFGASGVGLIGIFNAFSGNVSSFAGWGLGTSGVRLIAGAPEEEKPAKVAAVRRMGWLLSLIGLGLGVLAFWPAARLTFGSGQYAAEMAIVAFAIPCVIASTAWAGILQASGQIASLAKVQISGALTGLLLGLPAIYLWGTVGIAVSIFLAAAIPAFVLWRAARSEYPTGSVAAADPADLRQLVSIGGALMVVAWLGQLSAYVVRLAIIRHQGLEAAGYYQAAFAVSGSLPGFVFAAMGADFYPRIAAAKNEYEACHVLEKQIQAGLLLGTPLVMALLTLGKPGMRIIYSSGFEAAIPLLSWMTWGVFVRLITWPFGFWLLARGSSRMVIAIEAIGSCVAMLMPVALLGRYGLASAAVAFTASCIAYGLIVAAVFRLRSGTWFGLELHYWVAASASLLALGQWWASNRTSDYAGALPVILVSMASAWAYRHLISKSEQSSPS